VMPAYACTKSRSIKARRLAPENEGAQVGMCACGTDGATKDAWGSQMFGFKEGRRDTEAVLPDSLQTLSDSEGHDEPLLKAMRPSEAAREGKGFPPATQYYFVKGTRRAQWNPGWQADYRLEP